MALPIDARPSQPMPESQFPGNSIDITPPASGIDHRNLRSSSRRTNMGVTLAAGAAVLIGGAGSVFAQEGSPTPDTSFQPDGSSLPTDPITGALPSCPPEASPSPVVSPSPTPVILAFVNNEGQNVNVTLADQELPSAPPSVKPSITPDPETALIIDPCEKDHGLSHEEIEARYSLDVLFSMEHKPIDDAEFERIIRENAPLLLRFYLGLHDTDFDTEEEVWGDYKLALSYVKNHQTLKQSGPDLFAQGLLTNLKNARIYAQTSILTADAFWNSTVALYDVALNDLTIEARDPDARATKLNNFIKRFN